MTSNKRPITIPLLLITGCILVMIGCIPVPTLEHVIDHRVDVRKKAGGLFWKPLRIGRATRAEVYELLGKPDFGEAGAARVGYAWKTENGRFVRPLCFSPIHAHQYLAILAFDADGRLSAVEVYRKSVELSPWDPSINGLETPDSLWAKYYPDTRNADHQ